MTALALVPLLLMGTTAADDPKEIRVLFLGNSLTAGHDVPAIVQAMAKAGGRRLTFHAVTPGGVSLEDHWQDPSTRDVLRGSRWDFLVLQQGPSSRDDSRANLREWASRWADAAREAGAKPALYMVWPVRGQADGFRLVGRSYREAAEASRSLILPAGEAWREALELDATTPLYQPDDLHSTEAGAYLAATIITHGLTGLRPSDAPSRLDLPGGRKLALPEPLARRLRDAAEAAIADGPRASDDGAGAALPLRRPGR